MTEDRLCREEGCGKKVHAHGLCMRHYVTKRKREAPMCLFSECGRPSYSHGLCKEHRAQRLCGETLRPVKPYRMPVKCSFSGCERKVHGKGLCRAHWGQMHHGQPLTPIRSRWHRGEPPKKCSAQNCSRPYAGRGLCREHYWVMKYKENKQRKAEEGQKRKRDALASALAMRPAFLALIRARSFCSFGGF